MPEEIDGKSSIKTDADHENHRYFNVTDADMKTALSEYETYTGDGNFELYDTVTTGSDGKLLIENLDWGEYFLVEETAPDGYSKYDTTLSDR